MAIISDSDNVGGQVSNTVLTWQHTCGAGATLLVVLVGVVDSTLGDRTISGVTYNGDALTNTGVTSDDATEGFRTEIWYRINPDTGGAYDVVVTAGGKCTDLAGMSSSVTGSHTTDPIGSSGIAVATGANPAKTVTDCLDTSWLMGIVVTDQSDYTSITPLVTEIGEQDVGADVVNAQRKTCTAGSVQIAWSDADTNAYVISVVEILMDTGGGGFNAKVMVNGVLKDVSTASVMVNGAWKAVSSMKVMVNGAWKTV